jgi:flagellum-specific peptidoglycan hydrolase FlgJ
MPSAGKPWWQQATALVSLGAGGAVTGFSFIPRPAADLTSPSSMPAHLMALEQSARPAAAEDGALRSAIVNVAGYYRRMAESKTPAEMEAIIWQRDSIDGVNHGASCAAFASLTLELGAHVTGRQSWVTGGSTYPWPLHDWVDARVNPNPDSPGITSIVQDAQAHDRWHALGDGYQPLPGDWVVFNGHVEVVTGDANGVLSTIGGDSLPNFSVNAHEYPGPLAAHGVLGFVNNGALPAAAVKAAAGSTAAPAGQRLKKKAGSSRAQRAASAGPWAPTGLPAAEIPAGASGNLADTAVIPGLPIMAHRLSAGPKAPSAPDYRRHSPSPAPKPVHDVSSQQAFIGEVAPGAIAAQRKYGVPASVTIAQAIDESGWGKSTLATKDHNLFGIKGTGPAGSDPLPSQEYQNGQLVTTTNSFRVYNSTAESIDDHGKLLATSGYYRKSMADRRNPNAFAESLTGIYATDPSYGTKLISLMQQYNLYRYDAASPATRPEPTVPATTIPGLPVSGPSAKAGTAPPAASPSGPAGTGRRSGAQQPGPRPVAAGPQQRRPTPAPSGPTAATSAPTAAAPAPSAARYGPPSSAAPSGPASPQPTPSATPSGRTPSGTPSAAAPAGPAPAPALSGPAPSAPPRSGPAPLTRPAPTASAQPTPPTAPATAPSGPAPAAPTSPERPPPAAGPSVPGLPAAATEPSGAAPSAQIPAGTVPVAGAHPEAPSAAARAGQERSATATAGEAPALAPQAAAAPIGAAAAALTVYAGRMAAPARRRARRSASRHAYKPASRYQQHIPPSVRHAFVSSARGPLIRAEPLYQDVASHSGISWELLAACDWMQCEARARYSPVHGEKLGAVNGDGTSYHTKSEALEQCAEDLVELAETVYAIDLTAAGPLSVRDLANAFAAFRWGGLLRLHRTSAMEFPYSVAGLTPQHLRMRWPRIADPNTPDRPGSRFRKPFGAVPIVLSLNYPATV